MLLKVGRRLPACCRAAAIVLPCVLVVLDIGGRRHGPGGGQPGSNLVHDVVIGMNAARGGLAAAAGSRTSCSGCSNGCKSALRCRGKSCVAVLHSTSLLHFQRLALHTLARPCTCGRRAVINCLCLFCCFHPIHTMKRSARRRAAGQRSAFRLEYTARPSRFPDR